MKHLPSLMPWLAVLVCALAFRLVRLDARPMHADEAVQAARTRDLWLEGNYRYDPQEFHGPTLNYFSLPALWLTRPHDFAESTEATYRMVPAIVGVCLLLLVFGLRNTLNSPSAWWAGCFTAVSPAMVFYSRYYIHETLLVFFTLGALFAAWRCSQTGALRWYVLAGLCLGCMQATKETAPLAVIAMVGATMAVALLQRAGYRSDGIVHQSPRLGHIAVGAMVAAAVTAIWLSSFFTNPRGVWDGVLTYTPWLERASGNSPHLHPWYFYLHRLAFWRVANGPIWSEAVILVLALAGWGHALIVRPTENEDSRGDVFVRWLGFYALVLLGIYSLIPYKTPWCLIGFHHAMILLAGCGVFRIGKLMPNAWIAAGWRLAVGVALVHLGWQAYRASFVMPADPRNPYVYAQTSPDMQRLAKDLEQISTATPSGDPVLVKVLWKGPYYWPLPWYLRRMSRTGYWSELPEDVAAPLVISSPEYDEQLTKRLDATHLMTGYYAVRPGSLAQLWVSMDLWESHLRRIGRLP